MTDIAFADWVASARAVTVAEELARRGIKLAGRGTEVTGPCPVCGGRDRFGVNVRKNLWHCRKSGRGGDAIALVEYLDEADFLAACETLTGAPPPRGEGSRASAEDLAAREQERRAAAAAREAEAASYRERERERLYAVWCRARHAPRRMVEDYLALRGLVLPPGAPLRFVADWPYFEGQVDDGRGRMVARVIHRGPAMLAAVTGPDDHFQGLHATWLDLSQPKGRAVIVHPETGKEMPSRKVRGHKKGGRILLVRAGVPATDQFAGEGIETVLSVWLPLLRAGRDLAATEFVAGIDLGNLAGRAVSSVRHPTLTLTDKAGRVRAQRVPGPDPDLESEALPVAPGITRLTLLGDSDSDPFTTRCAMARAERRHAAPGRDVATRWPPDGMDFNDLLRLGRGAPAGRDAA